MLPQYLRLSSEQFLASAQVVSPVDVALILLLGLRVKPPRSGKLKWFLVAAAAVFWSIFALVAVRGFWDSYYGHFYPAWLRSGENCTAYHRWTTCLS